MARLKCPRGEKPVSLCVPEETPTGFAGLGQPLPRAKCPVGFKPVSACPSDLQAGPTPHGDLLPRPAPEHYGLGEMHTPKCAYGEVPVCTPRHKVPGLSGLSDLRDESHDLRDESHDLRDESHDVTYPTLPE